MLKDIKLGFKLLKYGYKLKLNIFMLAFLQYSELHPI